MVPSDTALAQQHRSQAGRNGGDKGQAQPALPPAPEGTCPPPPALTASCPRHSLGVRGLFFALSVVPHRVTAPTPDIWGCCWHLVGRTQPGISLGRPEQPDSEVSALRASPRRPRRLYGRGVVCTARLPAPRSHAGSQGPRPQLIRPFPAVAPCCEPPVQLPRGLRLRGRPPARIRCLRICLRPSGLRTAHGPSSGRQALRLRTWKWGGDVTGWAGTASGRLLTGLLHLAFQTIKLQHRVNQGHASVYSFTAQVLKLDFRTQSPASSEVGGVPLQVPGNRTGDLPRRDPVVSPSRSSRQRFQSPSSPQFPPSVPAARRWRAPRLTEEVPLLPAHPFGTGSGDGLSPPPLPLPVLPLSLPPRNPLGSVPWTRRGDRGCAAVLAPPPPAPRSPHQPAARGEGRASLVPGAASPGRECVVRTFRRGGKRALAAESWGRGKDCRPASCTPRLSPRGRAQPGAPGEGAVCLLCAEAAAWVCSGVRPRTGLVLGRGLCSQAGRGRARAEVQVSSHRWPRRLQDPAPPKTTPERNAAGRDRPCPVGPRGR